MKAKIDLDSKDVEKMLMERFSPRLDYYGPQGPESSDKVMKLVKIECDSEGLWMVIHFSDEGSVK